jgi:membrane protease YdiL (CAAX protease family)
MENTEPALPANPTPNRSAGSTPQGNPIFFGPDGLRAGWSLLLYVGLLGILITVCWLEVHWLSGRLHQHPGVSPTYPAMTIFSEASLLLSVVLATAFMGWLEHRRAAFYGLAGVERLRQFLIGAVCGFAFLSLLIGILTATHHLTLDRTHMGAAMTLRYAAAWGLCFFLVGMTEELMLRGYLLFTLARGIRFWPAAVLLAALFGLLHKSNPGESPFGLAAAALIALVFSLSLWRLGHLWWAIGFHMTWDWAESFFYGTADSGMVSAGRLMHAHPTGNILISGGATGPEGSAWILLIVALAALLVWKTQPYRGLQLATARARRLSPEHPTEE